MCRQCNSQARELDHQRNLCRMLAFARQHDWGHNAHIHMNVLYVEETSYHIGNGKVRHVFKPVRTMSELRRFAGY